LILKAEGRECRLETAEAFTTERARELTRGRRGLILMDRNFEPEAGAWREAFPGFTVMFPSVAGEAAKSLEEAARVLEALAAHSLNRDDWLIARGGGSVTDLGGFCAGLYQRGLKLGLIPTTLLGAVDAAVGGKTAVNFAGAKNQLGHFYLPRFVLADLPAIRALPEARLAEGLAEAYKTGLLFDPRLSAMVEGWAGEPGGLAEIIRRSVHAKAALVAQDFREEKGLREVLNLGHTFGHVAESFYSGLSHGRAVALGLAVMAQLSRAHGLDDAEAGRITSVARRLGGPWPASLSAEEFYRRLKADKKNRGGRPRFIVLKAPQQPEVIEAAPEEIWSAAVEVLGE
jgi:3-dehydroquinate synthetase